MGERGALIALVCVVSAVAAQGSDRGAELERLQRLLPRTNTRITGRISAQDKTWEEWVRRTGELPPDFDAMPSMAALPDPLVLREGGRETPIANPGQWERQRKLIRAEYERWVYGKMPPAPGNLRAAVTGERKEGEVTIREVRLEFGPGHRASLRVQLAIPPGKGPFPVFLTNHPRTRPWISHAVRRGYIGAIYFAADPIYGSEDDSDKYIDVYPEYDFSCVARWAWAAMRAVDYLYTLPEVDKGKIGIAGHSRNGKQALLAAAFDERIAAAAPSSGNTGEGTPWRYTTDMFANESIEQITGSFPHWFHPRLRFFAGREHKLPVDQNLLMAMVAPRGLLLASAYSETQGNAWGFEQSYRSVRRVYEFLGKPERVGLYLRPGEHPTTAEDIEQYVDFFDTVFGRAAFPRPEAIIHGYSYDRWLKVAGKPPAAPRRAGSREEILRNLRWALGEEPAGVRFPARTQLKGRTMTTEGWLGMLYGRPLASKSMQAVELPFGDDLKADLYLPAGSAGGKLPLVVWLHPYAYPTGYSRYARQPFEALTAKGFAVLAFDQIGFGSRSEQARRFYERYPRWSLMGKMVADTRAAIDAAAALESVDATKIFVVGYALGAKVGLFTAALDERVAGVVSVCGFTPLRQSSAGDGTEGVRHYSHLHGLMPRLGAFVGREKELPVDYDEVISAIGRRPLLVVAPTLDRYARLDEVRRAVPSEALYTPEDFNRFGAKTQEYVWEWLGRRR